MLSCLLGIDAKFEVTKELACINSLCRRTTDEANFKEAEKTLNQYNIHCNMLGCIKTNGGKTMRGAEKGRIYKGFTNGYALYYSPANTLWET